MHFDVLQFDEGKVVFTGEPTEEAIKAFVLIQSLPLVVEFNHETATKIFGGDVKSHLLLFLSKKDGHYEKYEGVAKDVAKGFREKVRFTCRDDFFSKFSPEKKY